MTTTTVAATVDSDEVLGPFPAGDSADPEFIEVLSSGRILRFDVEFSTDGNTGAIEIGIFGSGE